MRVVALDLALTACGVAWVEAHGGGCHEAVRTIKPPANLGKGIERLDWLMMELERHIMWAELVLIEGYAYNKGFAAQKTGELGGAVRLLCHREGIPFVVIQPAKIKMLATGKGNAGKDLVLAQTVRRMDPGGDLDNNQADALWLLQFAQIHYDLPGRLDLPLSRRRALQGIKWP